MKIRHPHLHLFLLSLGLPTAAMAVDKANNATPLDQGASWVGGLAPGTGEIAAWTSTVTAANGVALGSDASWAGVQVVGPGGLVTLSAGNTLTLGASGINLSTATQNLTLNCGLTLATPQAWTVASGRLLTVGGLFASGGNSLTLTSNAVTGNDVAAVIANGSFAGGGNLTKAGPGVMALGTTGSGVNFSMNAGTVIQIDGGTLRNELGATGLWTDNLSSLKVASGAIFDIGDTDTVVDSLAGVAAGFGTVQKNGTGTKTLTIGANHGGDTFSGAIKRLGGVFILNKAGSGTATLAGNTDNNNLLAAVKGGTLVLDKASSTPSSSPSAGVRAVYGITDIAPGATLKLAGTVASGTVGDQINGFGQLSSGVAGTGTVVMTGGTLDFNGKSEGWDVLSGSGTITNSGAAASTMTLGQDGGSGSFSGTIINGTSPMSVSKTGFGTQTLSGTSTYTGATALTRGTLLVTGSLPNSTLTVSGAANSILGGEGSAAAVVLGNGTKLSVDPSTSGALSTKPLTVNVTTTPISVVLTGGGFSPGVPFKVINYTSNANGWTTAKFALANAASYRTPVFSDSGSAVSLSIGASSVAWNNASADSKWNLGTSVNFSGGEKFYTFDTVTFGNLPAGNQVIAVDGALQPTAWNINSSLNYTFNNGTAGSITGPTGLVKSGTGTATLNLTNAFTGTTTVSGGLLAIASDAALGAAPATATAARISLDGGTLGLSSAFALSPNRGIAIGTSGAGLDTSAAGNGSLVEIASEITGSGSLSIAANGDTSDAPSGAGALSLSNSLNAFTGDVTIATGLVSMGSKFGATGNTVVLNGGGLVAQGANTTFGTNLLVGASGTLRTAATTEISGTIATASGAAQSLLRHTEGGILTLSGSGAGFVGTYSNLRGATVIAAPSANWAQTAFVLDPNGSTLTFNGGGTAKVKSVSSTRNVQLNDGTTLDAPSIDMATNAHSVLTTVGTLGALTSSTGTLTVTNGATSGTLGTLDHQLQVVLKDPDGFTSLALVKNNTNLLVLSQPNSYSGGTTINLGRLQTPNPLSLGSGPVTVNSGGQLYLTSGGATYTNSVILNGLGQPENVGTLGALRLESNTLAGNLLVASPSRVTAYAAGVVAHLTGTLVGSANLETTGSGTINLTGDASGYSGTLTAGQGTLNLNSPVLGGSLIVADGATLSGEGAVAGNLSFGTAATSNLLFNPSTSGALNASGSLAVNGTVVVGLSGAIPAGGTYKVLGFGSKSGAWTAANFSAGSSFRPGTAFTVNANEVLLTITKSSLIWSNAAANSIWDTNNTANFRDSVPTTQKFYWGDDVSFTDVPAAAQTITINGVQQPSSVTVNSQFAYTFNAGTSGVIGGGASLLKSGTGTLTVNLANSFSGGTTISQGTLVHGNAAATGSITSGAITLGDANSEGASQELVFTTGVQNLNNATSYKPVTVTADGTGSAVLTFNQGASFANLTLNTARAVLLRTTGTGSQSGMMGAISGAGAGADNESITFSAPTDVTFTYTAGYSGSGVVPNTFVGNVRLTGGGTIVLQNPGYINSAYENGIIPDASSVTVTSGTTWTLNWGDETIDALDGGGNMINTSSSTNTLTLGTGNGSGTFTGVMSGAGGVVKTGTGTQELIGANTYTGANEVNGGTLALSARTAAYGSTTVADGATLAITGSGGSKWSTSTLALGAASGATLTIGNFASGINPCVEAKDSLAAFGVVQVNISGIFSGGVYPLIRYPATGIEGNGFGAFVLGSLPPGITATLEDNGTGTIFLNVTDAGQLTWTGATSATWDKTTSNWKVGAAAALFADGDNVLFNDTVTAGRSAVVLNTTVSPLGVTFSNGIATPYSVTGSGAIAGTGTLIKSGAGKLTLANANTFSGGTSVAAGELEFGDGTTDGSVTGNLSNAAAVSFNNVATQTFAGLISGTGTLAKKGSGTLILTGANTYSGNTTINQGTLQLGNGTTNGSTGTGTVSVPAGCRLYLNFATATPGGPGLWSSFITGAGTLELNSTQTVTGLANWGPNGPNTNPFNPAFTGTLVVDNGRIDSWPAGMGGISKMVIKNGAQFLAWSGTYNMPVEIAGNGWGETGYPSALRVAASGVATWAGSITLTANAGIYSQDGNSVFTLTGPITGPYECDFIRNGPIVVQPAAAVQNSYGSTKISNNGGSGVVLAGNPYAFSTGGLIMNGGVLALNDFSFSFANLSGTSGSIINNSATAAVAVISVGTDHTSTSCAATLLDGNTGKLGLTKVGTGSLTLTAAHSNTGPTTVDGGSLLINGSLSASSAVAVDAAGTLGGSGSVPGSVTAGGTLAPGSTTASTGTLTLGATTLTGTYACQLNGASCDLLAVTGNLTLTGATLAVSPLAGGATQNSYLIATYTGTRTGTFATVPSGYSVDYSTANQVKLVAASGYAAWIAGYGLTGSNALANADPDKDGVTNALEFVFGGNPATVMNAALRPTIALVTDPGGTVPSGSYLKFTYRRTPASAYLNPGIEYDADLTGLWTAATSAVQVVTPGFFTSPTPADKVDVYVPRSGNEVNGKLYGRLRVAVP